MKIYLGSSLKIAQTTVTINELSQELLFQSSPICINHINYDLVNLTRNNNKK